MKLFRLVYHSRPSFDFTGQAVDTVIKDILTAARKNNPKLGVTGGLLFTNNFFVQVLEGEMANVKALARKIADDPRHNDFKIMHYETCDTRWFQSWSMACVKVGTQDFDVLDTMLASSDLLDEEQITSLINVMRVAAHSGYSVRLKPIWEGEAA